MPIIRIIARKAGHRRAGLAHPATWVEYPAGRFPEDDLAALLADPMLIIEVIEGRDGPDGASPDAPASEEASPEAKPPSAKGRRP